MKIILISAVSINNVIGDNNKLPWHLPEDLKHFKELTSGHTVVMGRKTYESIIDFLGKPLPNRKNIVITSQSDYEVPAGVEIISNVADIDNLNLTGDVYIIGGGSVYAAFLPKADVLEITHVHQQIAGDVYFPEVNWDEWQEIRREDHEGFSFVTYERK